MGDITYDRIANDLWQAIEVVDTALDERDQYTRNHSRRLVKIASRTGEQCGLSIAELKILQMAANMHDIGKIGVPDAILLKPDRLHPEEWEIMKSHSIRGERIISKVRHKNVALITGVIRHHHEHYDGNGYPDGLKGEAIPYLSRIVSVCDSYDAMTTTRVYSRARSHVQTLKIMHEEEGQKNDPYVFRHFLKAIGNGAEFRPGTDQAQ